MPAPLALKERLAAVPPEVELFAGGGSVPPMEDLILGAEDFCEIEIPPRNKYLAPWLQESAIIAVNGLRGIGKSMFGLGVIDAVTKGHAFGPWKCLKSTNCLYIDGEMVASDIQERLRMFGRGRKSRLLIYSDAYVTQHGCQRANLLNDEWREWIKAYALRAEVKIVVFDNLSSLCPGIDENSKQEFDPVNQFFLDLRFSGITVIYMHHMGKSGSQRGTSGREDNIDIAIELKRPPGYVRTEGCRLIVSFTKARIENASLHLIANTEMQLIRGISGIHEWTFKNSKPHTKVEVLKLLVNKVPNSSIADTLKITPGRVSQLRTEFVHLEYLTSKGKLTQAGQAFLLGEG